MTKHDACHKLNQGLAHLLCAEKKLLSMSLTADRTDLLHYVREAKYILEFTVDRGLGKDLVKTKTKEKV
jgi:hypothetical protein